MILFNFHKNCRPQRDLWPGIKRLNMWFFGGGSDKNLIDPTAGKTLYELRMRSLETFNMATEKALGPVGYRISINSFATTLKATHEFEFSTVFMIIVGGVSYSYIIDSIVLTSDLMLYTDDVTDFFYENEFNPSIVNEGMRKMAHKGLPLMNPYVYDELQRRGLNKYPFTH